MSDNIVTIKEPRPEEYYFTVTLPGDRWYNEFWEAVKDAIPNRQHRRWEGGGTYLIHHERQVEMETIIAGIFKAPKYAVRWE